MQVDIALSSSLLVGWLVVVFALLEVELQTDESI